MSDSSTFFVIWSPVLFFDKKFVARPVFPKKCAYIDRKCLQKRLFKYS